ncbi:MAG: HAD family hydrolase [Bacteroidia bacterium]|nr:HAD family hydrolase [Bacteroidia bacterium]
MTKPDSLIFDMDGTLWDNVHTYTDAWNKAVVIKGYKGEKIKREELEKYMGKEISEIVRGLFADLKNEQVEELFREVEHQYRLLVPDMQPRIYDGVVEGLKKLSKKYPLFLLSNCEEGGLVNFMNHTKTTHLITDYMEHGQNMKPKSFNMKLLKERNNLKYPVYIGDTDSDSKASFEAGLPFVFVSYGFGKTDNYAFKFDSFSQIVEYFLNL